MDAEARRILDAEVHQLATGEEIRWRWCRRVNFKDWVEIQTLLETKRPDGTSPFNLEEEIRAGSVKKQPCVRSIGDEYSVIPFYSSEWGDLPWLLVLMESRPLGSYWTGYWCQIRTNWAPGVKNDCWAGFTPMFCTGWNGIPDNWTRGDYVPEAVALAAKATLLMEKQLNGTDTKNH